MARQWHQTLRLHSQKRIFWVKNVFFKSSFYLSGSISVFASPVLGIPNENCLILFEVALPRNAKQEGGAFWTLPLPEHSDTYLFH